jgi:hypothetical protein
VYYSNDRALKEHWFEKARREGVWKVAISYDPRKPDVIYIISHDQSVIEPCQRLPKDNRFDGLQLEEIIDYLASERISRSLHEGRKRQSDAMMHAHNDAIVNKAIEMTKEANKAHISDRQKTGSIRKNRAVEKEANRNKEGFDLRQDSGDKILHNGQPAPVHEIAEEPPGTSETKNKKLLGMLKKQQGGVK